MKKILFVINPLSGGGYGEVIYNALQKNIESSKFQLDIKKITTSNFTFQNYDLILIAGGDGSLSSTLPELLDSKTPFAIIPLGTGNDFAREFNLKSIFHLSDIDASIEKFLSLKEKKIAVWELVDGEKKRLFVNYFSLGFDGIVIKKFHDLRKFIFLNHRFLAKILNRFLYFIAGIGSLKSYIKNFTVFNQSQILFDIKMARSLLFSNIKSVIGLGVSNKLSDPTDNVLECIEVKSIFGYLSMILGLNFHLKLIAREPEYKIELNNNVTTSYQLDGEAFVTNAKTLLITYKGYVNVKTVL